MPSTIFFTYSNCNGSPFFRNRNHGTRLTWNTKGQFRLWTAIKGEDSRVQASRLNVYCFCKNATVQYTLQLCRRCSVEISVLSAPPFFSFAQVNKREPLCFVFSPRVSRLIIINDYKTAHIVKNNSSITLTLFAYFIAFESKNCFTFRRGEAKGKTG